MYICIFILQDSDEKSRSIMWSISNSRRKFHTAFKMSFASEILEFLGSEIWAPETSVTQWKFTKVMLYIGYKWDRGVIFV